MKRLSPARLAWLLIAPLFALRADAQTPSLAATPAPSATQVPQRITYQRNVPASVLKLMPRGAKSRFYGTFRLKKQGPQYALHLYAPDNTIFYATGSYRYRVLQLDLLFKTEGDWAVVNHSRVVYRTTVKSPIRELRFGASCFWLQPRRQRGPIIVLDCRVAGEYGDGGDQLLIRFADDLSQSLTVQSFDFGAWRGSTTLGQDNDFTTLDERGLMLVKVHLTLNTDSPKPPYGYYTFRWNGTRFVCPSKGIDDLTSVLSEKQAASVDAPHPQR